MTDKKKNSGYWNSGSWNSGDYNSGHYNSGDHNSGNWNSGNRNSGYRNTGYRNTGYWNSGSWNSGDYNSGDYNSGFFNTNTPTVRMFNKDTGLSRSEIDIPYLPIDITEWADDVLITRTYKEAWKLAWEGTTEEIRQQFMDLPNFDPDIFQEITGIDTNNDGKIKVECNGKTVYISKESAKALGLGE